MGKFTFYWTEIEGVCVIEPTVYGDERGYFMETYNQEEFVKAGIANVFVQDNHSKSRKGVLRGLHLQKTYQQAKLVRVIRGAVYDVAVDLRLKSPTYGMWFGVKLTEDNRKQFFIPKGFAHGFVVLSDEAEFVYKCDELYHPEDEVGLMWNDPTVAVDWPVPEGMEPILSEKDKRHPNLPELTAILKRE